VLRSLKRWLLTKPSGVGYCVERQLQILKRWLRRYEGAVKALLRLY
jgi:hypothetical protein